MNHTRTFDRRGILTKFAVAYGTREQPLFLCVEIAEWLGIDDVAQMLACVDDDEKIRTTLPPEQCTGGLQPNTEYLFLSEFGLFEVLFQSRCPIAKGLKKGIKQLLRDIRTGKGLMQSSTMDELHFATIRMLRNKMAAQQQK
jgi:prophage antirepressor-like protein